MAFGKKLISGKQGSRNFGRLHVRLPARLATPAASRPASLLDISGGGARLSLDTPPARGNSVIMTWGPHEAFGTISWVRGNVCGIAWDRKVDEAVLIATRDLNEAAHHSAGHDDHREAARAWVQGTSRFGFD